MRQYGRVSFESPLDHACRCQPLTPRQALKSRFVLLGVAVTAVILVALSATILNNFPEGGRMHSFVKLLCWKSWISGEVCRWHEAGKVLRQGLIACNGENDDIASFFAR